MNNNWEINLKRIWYILSAISLAMPLILKALGTSPEVFSTTMMITLGTLFVMSLPTSFFALPFLALFKLILEIETDAMLPAYLYLGVLNIIGYVQWFRVMPSFFGTAKPMKLPTILNEG